MAAIFDSYSFYLKDIDMIDEENRFTDMSLLLNEVQEVNEFDNINNFHQWDSNHNEGNDIKTVHDSITNFTDIYPVRNNSPSYDLIRKLVNSIHTRNVEINSLKLTFDHKELQIQTLQAKQLQLNYENEKLNIELAKAEQDIILLETKLQDIANFEEISSLCQVEDIRGQLLSLANKKLSELSGNLIASQMNASSSSITYDNVISQQSNEIKSLKKELNNVCDQLAQRTVLYAAHERRWHLEDRMNSNANGNLNNNLIETASKLQLMERRYEQMDRERVSLILQNKELNEMNNILRNESMELNEKVVQLDKDFNENSSMVIDMQATINRLRNSDYDSIEKELTYELESIKNDFKSREEMLKRQVDELNVHIRNDSEKKDYLMRRVNELSSELEEKNDLLLKMEHSLSDDQHIDPSANSTIIDYSPVMMKDRSYAFVSEVSEKYSNHYLSIMNASQQQQQYGNIVSPIDDSLSTAVDSSSSQEQQQHRLKEKVSELVFQVLHSNDLDKSLQDQFEELRTDLTSSFINYLRCLFAESSTDDRLFSEPSEFLITDEYLVGDFDNEHVTNALLLSKQLGVLKAELVASKEREEKQKSKLTLLLRKASEMSSSTINSEYQQQVELYKKEIVYFEQLAHQNRELGTLGSHNMVEKLESRILSKDDEIRRLQSIVREVELTQYKYEKSPDQTNDYFQGSCNKYESISNINNDENLECLKAVNSDRDASQNDDIMVEYQRQIAHLSSLLIMLEQSLTQKEQSQMQSDLEKEHRFNELQREFDDFKLATATANSDSDSKGINISISDEKIKQIMLYPEMLSPDTTLKLIKHIASRCFSCEEFVDLYEKAKQLT